MQTVSRNSCLSLIISVVAMSVLLTVPAMADIITRNYNDSTATSVGSSDILLIKGSGVDNNFSYTNYSGSGEVYYNPVNYSYLTGAVPNGTIVDGVASGYTGDKVYIVGNALGLKDSNKSSVMYGTVTTTVAGESTSSNRTIVLTNVLPNGITTNEGTLFNSNGSSPTYDTPIQIKGVGGIRVGWNLTLTVSGKISDYTDASGNKTPGKLIIERDGSDIRLTNSANDYSGGTQIGGGNVTSGSGGTTLTLQGDNTLGTGPIYFGSNDSKLNMGSYTLYSGKEYTFNGIDNQISTGGNYSNDSIGNASGTIVSPTFNAPEGTKYVYTGSLPTLTGTVTKTGKGSQTLGSLSLDSITVSEGELGFSGALTVSGIDFDC